MAKPVTALRLDPLLIERAKDQGINLREFLEEKLKDEMDQLYCPTCNQPINTKLRQKKRRSTKSKKR